MSENNYLPFDLETALQHPERVAYDNGKKPTDFHQFKGGRLVSHYDSHYHLHTPDGRSTGYGFHLVLLPESKPFESIEPPTEDLLT